MLLPLPRLSPLLMCRVGHSSRALSARPTKSNSGSAVCRPALRPARARRPVSRRRRRSLTRRFLTRVSSGFFPSSSLHLSSSHSRGRVLSQFLRRLPLSSLHAGSSVVALVTPPSCSPVTTSSMTGMLASSRRVVHILARRGRNSTSLCAILALPWPWTQMTMLTLRRRCSAPTSAVTTMLVLPFPPPQRHAVVPVASSSFMATCTVMLLTCACVR